MLKKYFFRGVALLLALLMAFSLCSCKQLDELRKNTAYWADEQHTAIVCNGYTYKPLDVPENALPVCGGETVHLLAEETPILLSTFFAEEYMDSYNDGTLLSYWGYAPDVKLRKATALVDTYDVEYDDKDYGNWYFCREDVYDEYADTLSTLTFDHFYYHFWDDWGTDRNVIVSDEVTDLINDIMKNATPKQYDGEYVPESVTLQCCDAHGYFTDSLFSFEVMRNEGKYFIRVYDTPPAVFEDEYDDFEDDMTGNDYIYTVPGKYTNIFDKEFSEYFESYGW